MGKNQSKLKRKDRSQSITWSLTSPSVDTVTRMRMLSGREATTGPHMEISQWLKALDLIQYDSKFEQFSGVEELLNISEGKIKELGVKNSAHRARMISSLLVLKKKYDKFGGEKSEAKLHRHSVAIDPGRLSKSKDG
ncbi:hypothetical protein RUM43_014879 [Polyplax serrata]|uniref:SAM domain-containing protein n=1 Tax=Polyplax serrata TaxID=468196 RepID=A0AAN8PAZ3_POLSC